MYLRTISTQPVNNIESNLTLLELSSDINPNKVNELIDSTEETSTIIVNGYDTSTIVNLEV